MEYTHRFKTCVEHVEDLVREMISPGFSVIYVGDTPGQPDVISVTIRRRVHTHLGVTTGIVVQASFGLGWPKFSRESVLSALRDAEDQLRLVTMYPVSQGVVEPLIIETK